MILGMYRIPKKPDSRIPDIRLFGKAGYWISGRIFKVLTFFCQFYNYQFIYLSCYSHFFHFPQLISQYFNRNLLIEMNIQYIRYIRLPVSGRIPDIEGGQISGSSLLICGYLTTMIQLRGL